MKTLLLASHIHAASQLREHGVALLRGLFTEDLLIAFRDAASRCFAAVESDTALAARYKFNPLSHSVPLAALLDFGCADLTQPIAAPGLEYLFSEAIGDSWAVRMEHSWLRKKFAQTPPSTSVEQGWHQDGALGVQFPQHRSAPPPMTDLLTCWIPLNHCGCDSPGLEFVHGRQPTLLHFTELDDASIRQRFSAEQFWAPELELGDGLVFLNSVLHRTCTRPEMRYDRLSIEYRIFPCS